MSVIDTNALHEADAVMIGTGAGMSTAAGYLYSGERFTRYFSDLSAKYGFRDMYSGGFTQYDSAEEEWAYWSRYVWINRYAPIPGRIYDDLLKMVKNKDYFVLTTNVDHCFQRTGFDKQRLFYTQATMACFSAASLAAMRRGITGSRSAPWCWHRDILLMKMEH